MTIPHLGAQLWLERDATASDVERLIHRAAETGLHEVRIFLMWPWIEQQEGVFDFRLFDDAFDLAAEAGLGVKATLTANSGPWWLGTGAVTHSHTLIMSTQHYPAIRRYVETCVDRYAAHGALRQWILWNEPSNPPHPFHSAEDPARGVWASVLERRYGSIGELNRIWLTGYDTFAEVPHVTASSHPAHADTPWRSFDAVLADCDSRAVALEEQIAVLSSLVRDVDPRTPLCVNPHLTFRNHAESGYDLPRIANAVDVVGASFHAPWTFSFAPRASHVPLMMAGLSLLRHLGQAQRAEVTEMQLGDTYLAGNRALGISAAQAAASFLLPALSGAESITGWMLNCRRAGYESGEWALLDNADAPTTRSEAVRRVRRALEALEDRIGEWEAPPADAVVIVSRASQAIQYAHAELGRQNDPGRGPHEAVQGAALLAARLTTMGIASALVPAETFIEQPRCPLIVVSHVITWTDGFTDRLLEFAAAGSTIVIDGTTGQYDAQGTIRRPWPGGLTKVGIEAHGLRARSDGGRDWSVKLFGADAGAFATIRAHADLSAEWEPLDGLRLAGSHTPVAWARPYGTGRLIYVDGVLAASVLQPASAPAIDYLLNAAASHIGIASRPLSPNTTVLRVSGPHGTAHAIWTERNLTSPQSTTVVLPAGEYIDLWNGGERVTSDGRPKSLDGVDGVWLLAATRR